MRPVTWAAVAIVLASAWGAVDEWHQSGVPGRTASIADLLADVVGAALAGSVALVSTTRGRGRSVSPADGRG